MADLLVAQRQELLLRELRAAGVVRVAQLAVRFGVSSGTIRRDLGDLAAEGHLVRVRGGAVPAEPPAPAAAPGPPSTPAGERTLGLLVPSATYYYPGVIAGVRAVAARRGARVVIAISDPAQPRDTQQIEELRAAGANGLLIAATGGSRVATPVLAGVRSTGLPFVLLERRPEDPYEPCEFVASDHRQGAFGAVRHLHRLGHRKVALYCHGSPTAELIREGHAEAVTRLGLDPGAPVRCGRRHPPATPRQHDEFIERCLAGGTTAAVVHSDGDAITLLQRLRARGLRTPEDLALIAYDDELAALAQVPLTAVAPAKRLIGESAAELLVDRLDGGRQPVRGMLMQPRLVIRRSCGAPPR
ncbi:substrate-binding domain-containing protein [Streptomyces litchfieldiae]|uniref:Substrate-binding domain-containing protein n=1 Tax=Streptomyces litchfieldiae TaxID=3075543 RepID=A0ABU2MM57_9ACTN|nr:substrate-binding domain-containing protein [Streptomyces sp. DSM 44938]MDT0342448.1 substrate-binding domain-containing protein [Streptomyces sp. DSM 44938]